MDRGLRSLVACVLALLVAAPTAGRAASAGSPKQMYEAALAREKSLRAAWGEASDPTADDGARTASPDVVIRARAIVTAYQAMVGRYPASGYSDNALWQAAGLAEDLFLRSRRAADRQLAVRLFAFLAREYPASPLAAQAADRSKRLKSVAPDAASSALRVAEPAKTARSSAPAAAQAPSSRIDTPADVRDPVPGGPSAHTGVARASAVSVVRAIRRTVLPEVVRISIELDREVEFRQERVENPARLLFDLPSTRPVPGLRDANWAYQDDVVRHIRVGRHPNQTTRVVLDLDGVSRYTVVTLYNPYRILIDCERTISARPRPASASGNLSAPGGTVGPAPDVERRPMSSASPAIDKKPTPPTAQAPPPRTAPVVESKPPAPRPDEPSRPQTTVRPRADDAAENVASDAANRPPPAKPADDKSAEKTPPPVMDHNRVSMARQLGLGISRIVIDPGHGGRDPGAEGPNGTEAETVLDIALRLEKALARQPGIQVVLTRRSDVFVPLEQRTQIANREQADLFLSIHANASRNRDARGIESYYLNFASNPDAEAVAARENAASDRTMNSLTDIVKAIALNNKLDESKDFAALVQQAMVRRLRTSNKSLRNLGVKQAPFVVLIGASMPSVLAEVSFITNKREGQLLDTETYRQRIADALAEAILGYKRGLKTANIVAEQ